ncbi:MAG: hypothetical protein K2H18_08375, partial [Muribaculaceae bacterium]|nr:hypothetical protein [Muribaculaceae bacterium]
MTKYSGNKKPLPYPPKSAFLPTSKEEIEALGWDQPDVILFSGDAY